MPLCASVCRALWSPAGKGLTSLLLFVVSNCEFVTFPLVSWVRCGTKLYRFLIFAPLLTLILLRLKNPNKFCFHCSRRVAITLYFIKWQNCKFYGLKSCAVLYIVVCYQIFANFTIRAVAFIIFGDSCISSN